MLLFYTYSAFKIFGVPLEIQTLLTDHLPYSSFVSFAFGQSDFAFAVCLSDRLSVVRIKLVRLSQVKLPAEFQ
jgi:hypothetical protein